MSGYSLLSALAVTACFFAACNAAKGDDVTHAGGAAGEGGSAQSASDQAGNGTETESAGTSADASRSAAAGDHGEAGSFGAASFGAASFGAGLAGMAGETGSDESAGTSSGGAAQTIPTEISAAAGAGPTDCTEQHVTCEVLSRPACEFAMLAGQRKTLSCGETAVVATINCGGCGTATVKLYFDGHYCWQGAPECTLEEFQGKFVYPHLPGN